MAHNVAHEVRNGKLIITIDITPAACKAAPPSASGKTYLVASTGGSVPLAGTVLSFSLNVMGKRDNSDI